MHFQPGQLLSTIAEKKAVVSFESIKSLCVNVHALPCHFCFFFPLSNFKQHAEVQMWVHTRSKSSFCGLPWQQPYKTKNNLSTPQIIFKQLRRERKAGCCRSLSNNFLFSFSPTCKSQTETSPKRRICIKCSKLQPDAQSFTIEDKKAHHRTYF